jgi:hypothetical protein
MINKEKCALAKKTLEDFLARHADYAYETKVYSHDEWANRREPYGKNSLATLNIEGSPLYAVINGYSHDPIDEKLSKALEEVGFYYEVGQAIFIHIYEI